jgi:RNA polymerase sigma factor (sigma-70 family)
VRQVVRQWLARHASWSETVWMIWVGASGTDRSRWRPAEKRELFTTLRAIKGMTAKEALPEPAADAAAIRRSLREPRAFASVFDRHFDAVHRYIQRRVGRDLADNLAAETFARAFDRRRRYALRYPDARAWLLGIATNVMRRHWRTERRRLEALSRAAARPAAEDAGEGVRAELLSALRLLSRRDREAVLLLAWGDLSYEEIAVALVVPVGTVRSRLARARRLLRERLGEERGRALLASQIAKEYFHV